MSRVELVNIVKKITQLSQKDKADFVRILEQALEGGGGGDTSKFISVEPQDLTEAQQMQVRKNQGLYYSEGEDEEKTVQTRFVPLPSDWRETLIILEGGSLGYARYSTDIPNIDDWVQIVDQENIIPAEQLIFQQENGYYTISEHSDIDYQIIVVQAEGITIPDVGSPTTTGIYVLSRLYGSEPVTAIECLLDSMTYVVKAPIHHIEPKYIKDMYYEETIEGEKTVFTPDDPSYEWQYPDNYFEWGHVRFDWICEDSPIQEDIIKVRISNEETYINGSELIAHRLEEAEDEVIIYSIPNSNSAREKFMVVSEDINYNGFELKKGIYVPNLVSYDDPYLSEINYNNTTTIVHQVPQKYIPSTGISPVKMYVPTIDKTYVGMAFIGLTNVIPARAIQFSIEGETISSVSINGFQTENYADYNNEYTFTQEGIYYITVYTTDDNEYGALVYVSYPILS